MELLGKNVYLLPISKDREDTLNIVRWRNQPFVSSNFIYREQFTVQSHEKWMETMVDTGKAIQFIIYAKVQDKPIGSVYLRDIDGKNNKAEYGIFIGEENYLGKGFGRETAQIVLKYAFRQLQLHKIFLRVFACNQRALQSYKKTGFVKEGYFKDEVKIKEQYHDIVFMSVISDEFHIADEKQTEVNV